MLFLIASLLSFDFFFGLSSGVGSIVGAFFALCYSVKGGHLRLKAVTWPFVLSITLFLYIATGTIVGQGDRGFVVTTVKVILISLSTVILIDRVLTDGNEKELLKAVAISWALQAIFVLLCFAIPGFERYGNILRPPANSHIYAAMETEGNTARLFPASGQLLSGLSVIASAYFSLFFWSGYFGKLDRRWAILGLVGTATVGLVSGRSFAVGPLICIAFLSTLNMRLAIVTLFGLTVFGAIALVALLQYNPYLAYWAFEPVINVMAGKGFTSRSTDALVGHHLFIPKIDQVLFPSFIYKTASGWAAGSDSGYIRYALYGGPCFLTLLVLSFYSSLRRRFGDGFLAAAFTLSLLALITVKQESLTNASLYAALLFLNALGFSVRNQDASPRDPISHGRS